MLENVQNSNDDRRPLSKVEVNDNPRSDNWDNHLINIISLIKRTYTNMWTNINYIIVLVIKMTRVTNFYLKNIMNQH
jgi:hypothetical protein